MVTTTVDYWKLRPAQQRWIRGCEYNAETRRWENGRWGRGIAQTFRCLDRLELAEFAIGQNLAWLTPEGLEVRMHLLEDELEYR